MAAIMTLSRRLAPSSGQQANLFALSGQVLNEVQVLNNNTV